MSEMSRQGYKTFRKHAGRWNASFILIVEIVLILALLPVYFVRMHRSQTADIPESRKEGQPSAVETAVSDTAEAAYLTNPDSLLFIANKKHPLPDGYEPSDLRQVNVNSAVGDVFMREEAADALEKMFAAAVDDGITLLANTAYRSASFQKVLYDQYVAEDGQEAADTYSSRPGYSDHQTGLAVDISDHDGAKVFTQEMADTPEGKWLYEHAHKYGFVLRYPNGKEEITGYEFEPWHYRYIGVENAEKIYAVSPDETLEEYYNVSGGNYED